MVFRQMTCSGYTLPVKFARKSGRARLLSQRDRLNNQIIEICC